MGRCLYNSSFDDFVKVENRTILGELCENYHGEALTTTREAWSAEISIVKSALPFFLGSNGQIVFEYEIPRLGKRIDVVLLLKGIIFCLEFKVGETKILESDIDQVLDYALDLKNFHKFSYDHIIVPILIATEHRNSSTQVHMSIYEDRIVNPLICGKTGIADLIEKVLARFPGEPNIDPNWVISPYAPTPTIVEAARALYENHSVENITRHEADKVSTDRTIAYILEVIQKSKATRKIEYMFCHGRAGCGQNAGGA